MWGDDPKDYNEIEIVNGRGRVKLPLWQRLSDDVNIQLCWPFLVDSEHPIGCILIGVWSNEPAFWIFTEKVWDDAQQFANELFRRYRTFCVKQTPGDANPNG